MYTKFAAVHPSLVPGPLGFIICLSQNLIRGILDSAHPVADLGGGMGGMHPPHQPKSNDFGQKISLCFE